MKHAIVYNTDGMPVLATGTLSEADLPEVPPGHTLLIVDERPPLEFYVDNDTVVPIEPAPSGFHEFDVAAKQWVISNELMAQQARLERDRLLAASDWTQLLDAELSRAQREKWALYRKKLRRVPEQPGFPAEVVWPTPPGPPVGE